MVFANNPFKLFFLDTNTPSQFNNESYILVAWYYLNN